MCLRPARRRMRHRRPDAFCRLGQPANAERRSNTFLGDTLGRVASSVALDPTYGRRAMSEHSPIAALAKGVRSLSGRRRRTAAMVAGAVSALAMAPFFLWPVLWLTLPALVWLIDGAIA